MSFSCFKCALVNLFQLKNMTICLLSGILFLSAQAIEIRGSRTLDPTFGSGGKVFTSYGEFKAEGGSKTVLQPDGKIVMADVIQFNYNIRFIFLARYNPNGSLDTSFGDGGVRVADLPRGQDSVGGIAIQSDGKIVVAGYTVDFTPKLSYYDMGILRFNTNGSPDHTFGVNGVKVLDFTIHEYFTDVAIQPDGKIIAGGRIGYDTAVVRFNTDGSLDTSFHQDGIAATAVPEYYSYTVNNMALAADGKIIISGTDDFKKWFMIRHNPDGSLDTGFDQDGKVLTNIAPNGALDTGLVIQPNGKIIIGGFTSPTFTANNRDITLARYNSDGSLDSSFDGDGIVTKHPGDPNLSDTCAAMILQPDGKIVVLANLNNVPFSSGSSALLAILRFNTDGSYDTTYNGTGVMTSTVTGTKDYASSILVQPDGKFVVSGITSTSPVFALLRFNPTTRSPYDFDYDGKTDIGIFRPTTGAWWINSSSTNVTTAVAFGEASDNLVPADFTGDGKTDIALYRPSNGYWYVLRSNDYSFYGFPFGQPSAIPAPGDYDGDGKADPAIYHPPTTAWYILRSTDGGATILQFGAAEDKPVVADYDGDGKDDVAVYRPTASEWWILKSTGGIFSVQFGEAGDRAVPGDYTGDGKTDVAVWRPSNGFWYILPSEPRSFYGFPFGDPADIPAPGDYDGDGKTDAAVFRNSNASWYQLRSTSGFTAIAFGNTNDRPIPNAFVR